MANPLRFVDLFGVGHVEPSVTGLIEVQTIEPIPSDLPNDLIIVSPFRSGEPLALNRFRTLASLQNVHDPDRNGDVGVALARVARSGIADQDVFGAADILTVRVDPSTNAEATLVAGAVDVLTIATADYGEHTNRAKAIVEAGSLLGLKLTLMDDVRTFIGDNLGPLLSLQYTGDASTATVTIIKSRGIITYTTQPPDADKISVNGVTFEFDSNAAVTGTNIAVTIGADVDATMANLVAAILANVSGINSCVQDATANTITIVATETGVQLVEVLDTGNLTTLTHDGAAARLQTTLAGDQLDGSVDLDVPLVVTQYKSIDKLAAYIDSQIGYDCQVLTGVNKFIPSVGLDYAGVSALDITTGATLTGYVAALADFINNKTRGNYTATELSRNEPDPATYLFTGGTTMPSTIDDWIDALSVIDAEQERGGILLVNSDDPTVHAAVTTFVQDQRTIAGKWFRAYFGLPPALTTQQMLQRLAALDHSRVRATAQRLGVLDSEGATEWLHPVYFAAALAGGAAGNLPYRRPLTNRRLRFIGLHGDDSYDLLTRESLIAGGLTVAKKEEDRTMIALAVTTSRDPDRRMVRIASEIDTVDAIDDAMRQAFLQFRGKWAGVDIAARVFLVGTRVLDRFVRDGAIVPGTDESGAPVPAYQWGSPAFILEAGVLKLDYAIWIGGELNHISLHGVAEYQRIVAEVGSGGLVNLSTAVPLR